MFKNCFQSPCKKKIALFYCKVLDLLECTLWPSLLLFIRYWMAKVFFDSGLTKISSWESTLYLFQYEYKVPIIHHELAAIFATCFELGCPALLLFGLMTRLAAIPLLCMTAVIQFTYLDFIDHLYWAILLGTIILHGPGKLSIDHLIRKSCKES